MPGPSLREFWAELQRAKASGAPLPAAPSLTAAPAPAPVPVGGNAAAPAASAVSRPESAAGKAVPAMCSSAQSLSSGSNGAGYGLSLIVPDAESQEHIRKIMQMLCEQDRQRKR